MPEESKLPFLKESRPGKSYSLPHSMHMAIGMIGQRAKGALHGNASAALEELVQEAQDARALLVDLTPSKDAGN